MFGAFNRAMSGRRKPRKDDDRPFPPPGHDQLLLPDEHPYLANYHPYHGSTSSSSHYSSSGSRGQKVKSSSSSSSRFSKDHQAGVRTRSRFDPQPQPQPQPPLGNPYVMHSGFFSGDPAKPDNDHDDDGDGDDVTTYYYQGNPQPSPPPLLTDPRRRDLAAGGPPTSTSCGGGGGGRCSSRRSCSVSSSAAESPKSSSGNVDDSGLHGHQSSSSSSPSSSSTSSFLGTDFQRNRRTSSSSVGRSRPQQGWTPTAAGATTSGRRDRPDQQQGFVWPTQVLPLLRCPGSGSSGDDGGGGRPTSARPSGGDRRRRRSGTDRAEPEPEEPIYAEPLPPVTVSNFVVKEAGLRTNMMTLLGSGGVVPGGAGSGGPCDLVNVPGRCPGDHHGPPPPPLPPIPLEMLLRRSRVKHAGRHPTDLDASQQGPNNGRGPDAQQGHRLGAIMRRSSSVSSLAPDFGGAKEDGGRCPNNGHSMMDGKTTENIRNRSFRSKSQLLLSKTGKQNFESMRFF